MPSSYTVFPKYDYYALCLYVAKVSGSDIKSVVTKPQLNYLDAYLRSSEIGVVSVLCEYEYVEKFYLSDYSEYFVRCFHDYPRKASRIHFFSCGVDEKRFEQLLNGDIEDKDAQVKELRDNYLGYMVVRPIPETFIAKTCIRPYKSLRERRESTSIITCSNTANLFGIELGVDALPFQEQDRVVAICASAALWSFLNAPVFQLRQIPSPSQITKQASLSPDNTHRTFPSGGLSQQMLVSSLNDNGLDPISFSLYESYLDAKKRLGKFRKEGREKIPEKDSGEENAICADVSFLMMKELICAYMSCGFPVILGVNAFEALADVPDEAEVNPYECVGRHAVTISGCSYDEFYPGCPAGEEGLEHASFSLEMFEKYPIRIRAHKLKEIYVHDDQLGPYAAAKIINKRFVVQGGRNGCGKEECYEGEQQRYLDVSLWDTSRGAERGQLHIPTELLLGVIPKIRISYQRIKETCRLINKYTAWGWADTVSKAEEIGIGETGLIDRFGGNYSQIEWDIRLLSVNQFKASMLERRVVGCRERYLACSWPKHVWVASGWVVDGESERLVFDYIFDATDIDQGSVYIDTIYYSDGYYQFSNKFLAKYFEELINTKVKGNELYCWDNNLREVAQKLTENPQDLPNELDRAFGVPHPAAYIKDIELLNDGIFHQDDVQIFKFGLQNPDARPLERTIPYIWVVCEHGYLHLGRDLYEGAKGTVDSEVTPAAKGHPTLFGNMWARIAGELRYVVVGDEQEGYWEINNSSGRFERYYIGGTKEHLKNVLELFKVYFPDVRDHFKIKYECHND